MVTRSSHLASPPVLLAWTGLGFVLSLVLLAWSFGVVRFPASVSQGIDARRAMMLVELHVVLNETVQPTVAIVVDPDLLREKNPNFYEQAEKGDLLLIWPDKAVLYSGRRDRVLSMYPISSPGATQLYELPRSSGR